MDPEGNFCCFSDEIGKVFVCPVCKFRISPPVRQCRQGHLLCHHCFNKTSHCLVCNGALDNKRNVTLDALASTIIFPCTYADYGCREPTMPYKERVSHELYCPHRPFRCFVNECEWIEEARLENPEESSSTAALSNHLQAHHAKELSYLHGSNLTIALNPSKEAFTFSIDTTVREPQDRIYVLAQGEKIFLAKVHLRRYSSEGLLLVSVMGLARPTKNGPDHYYSVHVRGGECEMLHRAPVLSYMLSWEESADMLKSLDSCQGVINARKYTTKGGDVFLDFSIMTTSQALSEKLGGLSHETNARILSH